MNKEQLSNIVLRLNEQKQKRSDLHDEVEALNNAMQQTIREYAIGNAENDDITKAKQIIKEKEAEITELDGFIQQLEVVQGEAKKEYVPIVDRIHNKRYSEVQKEADEQIQRIYAARKTFAEELAKLGQISGKMRRVNSDFIGQLDDMNVQINDSKHVKVLQIPIAISGGYTTEDKALGMSEQLQKRIAKEGSLPSWLRE